MLARTLVFITISASVPMMGCIADQQPDDAAQVGEVSVELRAGSSLVSPNVDTICIQGAAFTGTFSTALNSAIVNYNALALSFHFVRTTGSTPGCDAVITAAVLPGFGTRSGFPSGGRPFSGLGLGTGFAVHNGDVLEHLITHLLGHNLGLLHSDGGTVPPISCRFGLAVIPNFGGADSGAGPGGVIIPGTPPPTPGGSIMNSCIPVATNGELTSSDIAGLSFLY
jgi:hypothetical protein